MATLRDYTKLRLVTFTFDNVLTNSYVRKNSFVRNVSAFNESTWWISDKSDMEYVEKTMMEKQKQQEVDDEKLDNEVERLRRRLEIQKIQSEQLELELQMKIMEKESNSLNTQKLDIEVKLLRLSVQKSLAMERIVSLRESLERLNLNKTA